jgi:inhibitor of KinA
VLTTSTYTVKAMPNGLLIELRGHISKSNCIKTQELKDWLLQTNKFTGIEEVICGYQSLYVVFDDFSHIPDYGKLEEALQSFSFAANPEKVSTHTIAVCYDSTLCPDLDYVTTKLGITKKKFIKLHSSRVYYVGMLGFLPGFIYMGNLDEFLVLPRKATPVPCVPEGSIGIAGEQTGVYSLSSPGGWHIIGRTPHRFFDAGHYPPMDIKAGDEVIIEPISLSEFKQIKVMS